MEEHVRICIYVRSNDRSSKLDTRLEELLEFAKQHSLKVTKCIVEIDEAGDISREGIKQLLRGLCDGEYEMILITSIDTITKCGKEIHSFLETVERYGKSLYSVGDGKKLTINSYSIS
ncbi:Resolvase, N terminal domain [Anaerobium acetethylicum]|uniref:Resolvase, N terminal domain n=2 Tax=Anaerobium acetethylicum TaxID=1619234 RepID=A0A1D3TXK3_9FIRM|nr:Resolvase, N terminal domain [Anaerobium acetethylicum]